MSKIKHQERYISIEQIEESFNRIKKQMAEAQGARDYVNGMVKSLNILRHDLNLQF